MKVLLLLGHQRPITQVKYNRDGDLLFSASKDGVVTAWYTETGERLGTYTAKQNSAVWSLDVDYTSTRMLTGGGDSKVHLWDVRTGAQIMSIENRTPVRCVEFAMGSKQFLAVTDTSFGSKAAVNIFNTNEEAFETTNPIVQDADKTPVQKLEGHTAKINRATWGSLNKTILSGSDDGTVRIWDTETGKAIHTIAAHQGTVNDIQLSKDKYLFITAGSDMSAKLWDSRSGEAIRTYATTKPINTASISPLKYHVALGVGQDASIVTQTKSGNYEVQFFNMIFGDELGRVAGHFSPINTIAFSPDGKGFTSGGEDGFVRCHTFDDAYLATKDGL